MNQISNNNIQEETCTVEITAEEVAAVRNKLEEASFLPPRVYADAGIYEEEKKRIFRRTWLPVCHISQIADPGNYFAKELFGESIVAVRGKDNEIRVMSNVCRHRNAALMQGNGKCRGNRLTCPYHGWAYGLDGQLLATPHMDKIDHFSKTDIALPLIRHEIWEGFVFINFDENAPALGEQLKTLTNIVRPYHFDKMKAIPVRRAHVCWNWKISLENFSEAYHQPFIHPTTADRDFPAATSVYDDSDGPYSTFWIPHRNAEPTKTVVDPVPGMPDSYYSSFFVVNVYPLLHIFTDSATPLWLDWEMNDVNDHVMVWYMLVPEDKVSDATVEQIKKDFLSFIEPIILEDVDVCNAVAAGVKSDLSRAGRLSHMEKAIHQFQNWWLDYYLPVCSIK
ncbi:aromatic ring-hydroxylating dioxygenase subunit alpha [Acetobacter senegalensis]|uniref:aromatic ring-hydroxylating oxygenase subunit alpha n=1 Tax=Acetobacter senegalensis TaxID=446692 RepID=UPI001EDBB069|nr:aromatic ring-hydroxylating dioxygenase subunit alpha [Acetobacter senegalensis]MCG4262430.1 aromatic ring-hydroxylating dioxygenase subunit alpha [Acetobacter senegalensis]